MLSCREFPALSSVRLAPSMTRISSPRMLTAGLREQAAWVDARQIPAEGAERGASPPGGAGEGGGGVGWTAGGLQLERAIFRPQSMCLLPGRSRALGSGMLSALFPRAGLGVTWSACPLTLSVEPAAHLVPCLH